MVMVLIVWYNKSPSEIIYHMKFLCAKFNLNEQYMLYKLPYLIGQLLKVKKYDSSLVVFLS